MIRIFKTIRLFFLRLFSLHNIITILERVNWLQNFHCYFTDITKAAPPRGITLLHQQAGAKLLEIFDQICKKYKLNYWLGSGNLLGFVRHNGNPVPWDDDMDIYMLRPDYEKAVALLPKLFEGTDFILFFTGWFLKIFKYKNATIGFDIFPMDQYFKKIETEHDLNIFKKNVIKTKGFSKKEYLETLGYTVKNYHKEIWNGNINKNSEKLFELRNTAKSNWDCTVMEGNKPANDGNLLIGYERAKWPNNQFSWNYHWIFPLQRMNYLNVETYIPNNPDLYLFTQFGDYWALPEKFTVHSHLNSKLPLEALYSLQELININASEFVNSLNPISQHE